MADGSGNDEEVAIWGRYLIQPGGYPSGNPNNRCLYFGVRPSWPDVWNEIDAAYIDGSWSWVRPGNWNCT